MTNTNRPIRRALVSVFHKEGIEVLAEAFVKAGTEVVSTGSTAKKLAELGVKVTEASDVTGFPECLDGRVKTLHPYIHAGILADMTNPEHAKQLEEFGIKPFDLVTRLMTTHFVSRQIFIGSGRVGIGEHSENAGYQLSQRADYFHMKVGLQTTFDRPIINTRDESHSTDEYRRLHVIVGDANRMDVPQALKLGTTSMLLWLLEHADMAEIDLNEALEPLTLADPVEAMHTVSHDLTLAAPLPLETGGTTTAWQMQVTLRGLVYAAAATVYGTDTSGEPAWPDRSTRNIMAMWGQALADVATVRHADDDGRLMMREQASRLEWLLKWQLLEKLRRKTGSDWTDRRLAAVDLKWAALDPADSIFTRLAGQTERLVTDKQLAEAVGQAPADTRAWLRAEIVRRFPEQVIAASWSHLTVRGESSGDENVENSMVSLDMSNPLKFTESLCSEAFERVHTASGIVESLR